MQYLQPFIRGAINMMNPRKVTAGKTDTNPWGHTAFDATVVKKNRECQPHSNSAYDFITEHYEH